MKRVLIIGIQFLGKSNIVCFDDQYSCFTTLLLFHFLNWDTSFEVCSIESFCSQEMNNAKLKDFTVISCALFEQLQVSFHGLKN